MLGHGPRSHWKSSRYKNHRRRLRTDISELARDSTGKKKLEAGRLLELSGMMLGRPGVLATFLVEKRSYGIVSG